MLKQTKVAFNRLRGHIHDVLEFIKIGLAHVTFLLKIHDLLQKHTF
jgi:hypothetical protein